MNTAEGNGHLLVLGNFVGRLLEGFPIAIRSTALKDIEESEERFCQKTSGLVRPSLAHELWKIEHSRRVKRDPRFKMKKIPSFGNAIESYLTSLPEKLIPDILKAICDIISFHGSRK